MGRSCIVGIPTHEAVREWLLPKPLSLLTNPTRYLFFTGKGGVGKTSLLTAVALSLADAGKKVLLVSTDAASNLDEMLGIELRNIPTTVTPGERSGEHFARPRQSRRDVVELVELPQRFPRFFGTVFVVVEHQHHLAFGKLTGSTASQMDTFRAGGTELTSRAQRDEVAQSSRY